MGYIGSQGVAAMAEPDLDGLEAVLGHTFARRALLELALTHSSVAHETATHERSAPEQSAATERPTQPAQGSPSAQPGDDNEQLEFLGDAALGLLVAESLYRRFPSRREGDLTRLRASLVSRKHLGEVGARLGLGQYLRLGKGEERSGGRRNSALLANAIEAVFAAIYLDGGLQALRDVVEQLVVLPSLPALASALCGGAAMGDHKSALQEHLQATGAGQPRYIVTDEAGPDHRKRFTVELRLQTGGQPLESAVPIAKAVGSTKKEAQQEAARLAYGLLTRETPAL